MLTREGGHRADRIVHAGGDATGAEVQRALHAAVRRDPWIRLVEHALVLDLLRAPATARRARPACGITLHVLGEGSEDGVGAILARAVVLATGGHGAGLRGHHQPGGLHRRRGGAGAAGRRGGHRRGVRPVPPDRADRPGRCGRPVPRRPSSRWSPRRCAARARTWSTATASGSWSASTSWPSWRPATWWPRASTGCCWPTGADHVYLDARHLGGDFLAAAVPDHRRVLPGRRRRPGDRPDPGRAGRPLRLRRGPHRPARPHLDPRPVRLRRGRLHGGARREPAGQQLAAGRAGLLPPDRRGHRRRPARRRPIRRRPAPGSAARAGWCPPRSRRRCSGR